MNLKRLWDTENKKIVWAIPTGDPHTKLQVWTNDDGSKLYIYDSSKWVELANPQTHDVETYGPVWKSLEDETVGYYLTNEPTDLYNWDSGDEVAYRFMNGTTVLESGTIDEGATPEYTGDTPTKSATAQYTYTFSGWKPTVGPIYKKTDYKAQFDKTVNEYTVSIASNDSDYGTVSESSVADVPYGTAISTEDNVLTIGEGETATEVTATAETGYVFSSWGELPATVTGDLTITATFEAEPTPVVPSIEFDSGTSETMAMLEYGEDEKWSNSVAPIGFNISDMETSQLSFSVENCVTGISDTDVTVSYSAAEEGDYDYALTISTAVDLSMLTPNEEDDSYFHVVPYYTAEGEDPVALGDVIVVAVVV